MLTARPKIEEKDFQQQRSSEQAFFRLTWTWGFLCQSSDQLAEESQYGIWNCLQPMFERTNPTAREGGTRGKADSFSTFSRTLHLHPATQGNFHWQGQGQ